MKLLFQNKVTAPTYIPLLLHKTVNHVDPVCDELRDADTTNAKTWWLLQALC